MVSDTVGMIGVGAGWNMRKLRPVHFSSGGKRLARGENPAGTGPTRAQMSGAPFTFEKEGRTQLVMRVAGRFNQRIGSAHGKN